MLRDINEPEFLYVNRLEWTIRCLEETLEATVKAHNKKVKDLEEKIQILETRTNSQ